MLKKQSAEAVLTIRNLDLIIEYFSECNHFDSGFALYSLIASKLSKVADHHPTWSWRYVLSVHKSTLPPSKLFNRAVNALALAIDGVSPLVLDSERVEVISKAGSVTSGSLVMGVSIICATPGCRISFVPNVPWRIHCFVCNPIKEKLIDRDK